MAETQQSTGAGHVARAYFEAIAARDLDAMTEFYEVGGTGEIHGLVELTSPTSSRPSPTSASRSSTSSPRAT
jgi:hypothetical protein